MRILHVLATCDPVLGGGVAERTRLLSKALTTRGAECTVLTQNIGLDNKRREELSHVDLRVLPSLNKRFYLPAIWPGTIQSAVSGSDVVELTSHWSLLNALAYRSARRLGVPYLVHPAGALGIVGRSATIKKVFNRLVGYRMVLDADGHIAVTRGEVPEYEAYGIGQERLTFIPNGVDLASGEADPSRFRTRHGLEGRRIILFVGRLSPIKGPDLLLVAFASIADEHPEYTLVLAGPDNGMLSSLRQTVSSLAIGDRVRFPGFLGSLEKNDAYSACDFLALPSRREAMSLVALEAGVRGKPVLMTDQCGFNEVETCGGGRVVEASVAGLKAGLRWMIGQDARLPLMGRALQQHVELGYTWTAAADTYLDLCRKVQTPLQRNPAPSELAAS